MNRFAVLTLIAIFTTPTFAADPKVADLAWLTGQWVETKKAIETTEQWLGPKGGLMLAVNRTVTTKKTRFEYLRIEERADGIYYLAQPGGKPPTEFKLKSMTAKSVIFESESNPFPKTIEYKLLDSGQLTASIAGTINGKAATQSWTWDKKSILPRTDDELSR